MIKIYGTNIDQIAEAKQIVKDAESRHATAKLSLQRLKESKIPSMDGFANNTEFIKALLGTLQDTAFVDIGDFEIVERRQHWSKPLIALKKTIWSLLRFYTFRLWSQQNEVNGFLLAGIQAIQEDADARIVKLEARIAALESRNQEPAIPK